MDFNKKKELIRLIDAMLVRGRRHFMEQWPALHPIIAAYDEWRRTFEFVKDHEAFRDDGPILRRGGALEEDAPVRVADLPIDGALRWFARAGTNARLGPFASQVEASKACMIDNYGYPHSNAFVWPERTCEWTFAARNTAQARSESERCSTCGGFDCNCHG